jgi:hypothetical protein
MSKKEKALNYRIRPAKPPDKRRAPGLPKREDIAPDELKAYDDVLERTWSVPHYGRFFKEKGHRYYQALLNSPPVALLASEGGRFFTTSDLRGTYTHAEREWIDQVLAVELNDNRVVGHHMLGAVAAGVRPEAIWAIRHGREEDLLPDERKLADYIREVARGEVTDESWQAIVDHFGGVRGAVEYTAFVNWLTVVIRIEQALDVWYDGITPANDPMEATSDEEIDDLIRRFMEGKIPLPPAPVTSADYGRLRL